ncbi:glycosyl transferase, partial [bacterium]|nr:glycosyl transferase [bacterium]
MKTYFYRLIEKYIRLYVRSEDSLIFCSHASSRLLGDLFPQSIKWEGDIPTDESAADYIIIDGRIHYERDIQAMLEKIHNHCHSSTRLIITFYSVLWRPLLRLATSLKWRSKTPEQNWLAPEDMENLLMLAGFELVKLNSKILCPVHIPLIANFLNRFVAPLPLFKKMSMVN